jgi:hypothetical protein
LALSHDAVHFTEPVPGFAFIEEETTPSPAMAEPYPRALMQGQGMYNVGDQTLFWYAHWSGPEVVVAGWERDRLGYIEPATNSARMVSCPLRVAQGTRKVYLNARIEPGGELLVSLLGSDGATVSGFENASIKGDAQRQQVLWPGGDALSTALGTVRIQLSGTGAWKVYAVYIGGSEPQY